MKIKEKPEDFIVKEIIDLDKKPEGKTYRYFLMRKRNITTIQAIKIIARKLHISKRKIYFAGEKDKNTISEQYIAIRNFDEFKEEYNFGDVYLKYIGSYDEPIKISDIKYNYFKITVSDIKEEELKRFEENIQYFKEQFFNYFDDQRFGNIRYCNHLIGKELVKKNYEEAIKILLTYTSSQEKENVRKAREFIKNNWGSFKEAIKLFPNFLDIERAVLNGLLETNNVRKTLRYIPKRILKLFVHSYQSYLWNLTLSNYIKKNFTDIKFIRTNVGDFYITKDIEKIKIKYIPTIGYNLDLNKYTEIRDIVQSILNKEKIDLKDLYNEKKPSLTLISEDREVLSKVYDFDYKISDRKIFLEFKLGRGSFATMFIKHLFS